MNRRLSAWLGLALSAGVLLAGCGSSSSTTSQSTPAATTPATTTPSSSGAYGSAGVAAATACKQAVHAQPTLAASTKTRLESICEKAASGKPEDVKKVEGEICEEVVKTVPAAVREQARASCKSVEAG